MKNIPICSEGFIVRDCSGPESAGLNETTPITPAEGSSFGIS